MSLSLSPQLRLIVIIGAAATLLALGGMMFVVRGQMMSGEVEQVPVVVHHPKAAHKTAPPVHKAAAKQATKPVHKAQVAPVKPAPKVAPTPETIKTPGVAENGLPVVIAQALEKHPVLVVALVVPGGEVDELTQAEGKAGAEQAGVGFLRVNILKDSVGRPLAQKLGVIQTPSLVVFQRPAKVFVRFAGFVDRDTVTQAATTARAAR